MLLSFILERVRVSIFQTKKAEKAKKSIWNYESAIRIMAAKKVGIKTVGS